MRLDLHNPLLFWLLVAGLVVLTIAGGFVVVQALPAAAGPTPAFIPGMAQFSLAAYPEAVCADGTPAVYYAAPGSGANGANWIIYLESGVFCNTAAACTRQYEETPDFMSSRDATLTRVGYGLLSRAPELNPDFYSFNQVYIPSCSADAWLRRQPAGPETGNFHFQGQSILLAVAADLAQAPVPMPSLRDADAVMLAGGAGALFNLNLIAAGLPAARVVGVVDSAWVPDAFYDAGLLDPPAWSAPCAGTDEPLWSCGVEPPLFVILDQRSEVESGPPPSATTARLMRQSLAELPAVFSPARGARNLLIDNQLYAGLAIDNTTLAAALANWFFDRPGPSNLIAEP